MFVGSASSNSTLCDCFLDICAAYKIVGPGVEGKRSLFCFPVSCFRMCVDVPHSLLLPPLLNKDGASLFVVETFHSPSAYPHFLLSMSSGYMMIFHNTVFAS